MKILIFTGPVFERPSINRQSAARQPACLVLPLFYCLVQSPVTLPGSYEDDGFEFTKTGSQIDCDFIEYDIQLCHASRGSLKEEGFLRFRLEDASTSRIASWVAGSIAGLWRISSRSGGGGY